MSKPPRKKRLRSLRFKMYIFLPSVQLVLLAMQNRKAANAIADMSDTFLGRLLASSPPPLRFVVVVEGFAHCSNWGFCARSWMTVTPTPPPIHPTPNPVTASMFSKDSYFFLSLPPLFDGVLDFCRVIPFEQNFKQF